MSEVSGDVKEAAEKMMLSPTRVYNLLSECALLQQTLLMLFRGFPESVMSLLTRDEFQRADCM
jgi:hypothetical protein